MKRSGMLSAAGLAVVLTVASARPTGVAWAAAPAQDPEVARLRAEVRELRGLVMQLMRVEKEHYDLLMNLAQAGRLGDPGKAGAPLPPESAPALIPAAGATAPGEARPVATGAGAPAPSGEAPRAAARTASLHGRVQLPGGTLQDVYAYVENVRSPPVHGKTVEIAQRKKQFLPEVTVVQRGTKVVFPNYDTFVHNVFSPTQPRPFDIGSLRSGEESKAVEMTAPGVVDVFCNMHSDMHASILVVPSPLYARVGSDGSFHLDGVPVGTRKVVVWSPRTKPTSQTVEVGPQGAEVSLTLEQQPAGAHNNKFNQPYPSYDKNQK
jgi:plastocyanin